MVGDICNATPWSVLSKGYNDRCYKAMVAVMFVLTHTGHWSVHHKKSLLNTQYSA